MALGVIAGLSFIALVFFSRLLMFFGDVVEDWTDHMGRWLWKKSTGVWSRITLSPRSK